MADLLLREREQAVVRALLASEPAPGAALPGECVLPHLARLVDCDALGITLLDGTGAIVGGVGMLHDWMNGYALRAGAGPVPLGEDDLLGAPPRDSLSVGWTPHLLTVGVHDGTGHVVRLWLVRRRSRFSARDRDLLGLVAPALERLLRERPTPAAPLSLTAQERRVLRMVAAGLSNAEIAERLFVAQATVRKHLENAYRKLGVTNHLAAVCALEGRHPADLYRVDVLA